jgi:transcriptional regulator with XRE-family HTH domain
MFHRVTFDVNKNVSIRNVERATHGSLSMRQVASRHFIRAWRKHRGLTQAQLAERIGIDRSYLSNIETGRRRYDQPFLEAAAEVLRCEPADLIVRDPTQPEGLWSIWDQLGPVERRQLVEMAKVLRRTGTDG